MRKNSQVHSMRGAGIEYKKKKFITHTTLPFQLSALQTFSWSQRFFIGFLFLNIVLGLLTAPFFTLQLLVGVVSILYFIDTVFNLVLTLRSLNKPNEIYTSDTELQNISDKDLPIYTILCPLYKEAHVIPQFVEAIAALDYPKNKLDVIILLEEDDRDSVEQVATLNLPYYFRTIVVPDSQPKTKPKACNYGLSYALGEYLVIYDAEDIPDPLQLKKAFLGFQKVPSHVVCLQAKLNYYNIRQNLLTRFFTAEYSLWFDITLTGLQSFNSTIPLGGTSNHFKTQILKDLEGWDPFNVTEDADLGIRLFKKGFKTAIIDSTTYEEATSNVKNWIRQRSRWIKGYMQTYLVHMRSWKKFVKENGVFHYSIFQLNVGGKLLFLLLNPLMWVITLGYFLAYPVFGPTIETIYHPPISYIAVFSWIFGNFLFLYYYMLGLAKRNQWDLLKYIFLIPAYWGLMSYAAAVALYQLILKPHYWEKTTHGFHLLNKAKVTSIPQPMARPIVQPVVQPVFNPIIRPALRPESLAAGRRILSYKQVARQSVKHSNQQSMSFTGLPIFKHLPFSSRLMHYLAVTVLLSFDFVIAALLLPADEARIYFLLSLTAKTAVVVAQSLAYAINHFLSKQKKSLDKFYDRIFLVFLAQWVVFIILGFEAQFTLPALLGYKYSFIIPYIGFYLFACLSFAIGVVFSSYHTKNKRFVFSMVSLLTSFFATALMIITNAGIKEMVTILAYLGTINVMIMIVLHSNKGLVASLENNLGSLFAVLKNESFRKVRQEKRLRILIFNWRDTKHVLAGGAEVYIQELAKRWVKDGNQVTLFCGNDNKNPVNERIDGVEIIRRGGTFTVYLFAFLYYLLKFRRKYDVVIDCENGIPFFTPLFTKLPVILLVHHIHQQVFNDFLKFPLKQIGAFLEGKVMPFIYRNNMVITVSESSKKEIIELGFTKEHMVEVVYNGVSQILSANSPKTAHPSFIYLGRLKEYKNIDVAIKAFAALLKEYPSATLSIVGSGEGSNPLKQLVERLEIQKNVIFFGRVSEERKVALLSQSWAMVQPSQLEGWGITVIEANMVGTPVIASKVNGLKDSVVDGKTGMLVPVKNIHEFTTAMKTIVQDAENRRMLSHNAYLWSKNFNWDKSASDFYALLLKNMDISILRPAYSHMSLGIAEKERIIV